VHGISIGIIPEITALSKKIINKMGLNHNIDG
jgi:hypothetical protein